jgi:hypothetical protein
VRELSLHILDIVENALQAGATRVALEIGEDHTANTLVIRVSDNGRGMDADTVRRVTDPFFTTRTTRHVGLGLPLFRAAAQRCGGDLVITSQLGQGTTVTATFQWDHIDRAPLGDLRGTLQSILLFDSHADLGYRHRVDDQEFAFDTAAMRRELGDVSFSHPMVREWLDEFLREGLAELGANSSRWQAGAPSPDS